jgi:chemotaxis protein histidine kinase CheA
MDTQVFGVFKEEASEHIQQMHRGLLSLRHDPAEKVFLREAARSADALMGSAITIGLDEIGENAKKMRDLLVAARDGKLSLDDAKLDLLFESLEALGNFVDAVARKEGGDTPPSGPSQITIMKIRSLLDELYRGLLLIEEDPRDPDGSREVRPRAIALRERSEQEGLDAITRIVQGLEEILYAAEEGRFELNQEILGLLLQGIGFIEILLEEAASGVESGAEVDSLCELLDGVLPTTPAKAAVSDAPVTARYQKLERAPRDVVAQKGKVLIASNSPLFRRELSDAMREQELEVLLSVDAEGLATHLQKKDVALCFLRDSLPDGLDVCERFSKSSDGDPAVAIVVFSPLSRARSVALGKGASSFLKVPCERKEVLALVERWVGPTPSHE